jgi:hypothetical protein
LHAHLLANVRLYCRERYAWPLRMERARVPTSAHAEYRRTPPFQWPLIENDDALRLCREAASAIGSSGNAFAVLNAKQTRCQAVALPLAGRSKARQRRSAVTEGLLERTF